MARIDDDFFKVDEDIKNNEIKDILEEDEQVLVTLKPDRKDYILEGIFKGLPVVLLWLGVDTFFIIMMFTQKIFTDWWTIIFVVLFFLVHLIPVWIYLFGLFQRVTGYKSISYVFTDKRIIVRSGVFGVDFKFAYYTDVESVNVKVSILDKLFRVGDVHIKSPTQVIVLDDIKAPYKYANKIQEITRDLKADMNYPNDLRPKENHGYNTKYEK